MLLWLSPWKGKFHLSHLKSSFISHPSIIQLNSHSFFHLIHQASAADSQAGRQASNMKATNSINISRLFKQPSAMLRQQKKHILKYS